MTLHSTKLPSSFGPILSFSPLLIIPCSKRPCIIVPSPGPVISGHQNWSILNSTGPSLAFASTARTGKRLRNEVTSLRPWPVTDEVVKIGARFPVFEKVLETFATFDSELITIGKKLKGRSDKNFSIDWICSENV